MSFLAPLYALGLLAIAGPIYFHLIRRWPKGQVPFSSLMFLAESPPPPVNRRRLDQVLLLVLRAGVLALLGFAFMRPFLRNDAASDAGPPGQRVAILIDTSASLRRGDLWAKAKAEADAALAAVKPSDRLGLYAFDRTLRPVFGFAESEQLDAAQRLAIARDRLGKLTPTWGSTELGQALVDGVGAVLEPGSVTGGKSGRVVLVSDLQQGAKLTALSAFEWPKDVDLELRRVADDRGNAGMDWLVDRTEAPTKDAGQLRVRVVNEAGSNHERFALAWAGTTGADVDAYVPPGESRVVKVPKPPANATSPVLKLQGDAHEFDNAIYLATPPREEIRVVYLGDDAPDDPTKQLYFLERAWPETPERAVRVEARAPVSIPVSPLVVVSGEVSPETLAGLQRYLKNGGTVLVTVAGPTTALASLAGVASWTVEEAAVKKYAMLRDIAFDHPLFAPLAGPQYGDFTKVHFWKHRRLAESQVGGARVLAKFDGGDPAILEKTVGRGRLVVFAFGWHPADTDLARSSKFVPLMAALLDLRFGRRPTTTNHRVGDRVPVPTGATAVRSPDGTVAKLSADVAAFDGTDQPGVYTFETPTGPRPFAVNLDPAESLTAPLPVETLEQFGCRLANRASDERREQLERQQRDVELERNQSLWRALLLGAIALVLSETALAGWRTRARPPETATT